MIKVLQFLAFVLTFIAAHVVVAELGSFDVPKPDTFIIDCGE